MSGQADISSILAALAAQQSTEPATQTAPTHYPNAQQPATNYPGGSRLPGSSASAAAMPLPQPSSSGSLDLSSIRPSGSGSVSISDAIAKARGFAAERGIVHDASRSGTASRGGFQRPRSRSRSPPRRDNARDNYNPYRDERRSGGRPGSVDHSRGGYSPPPSRSAGRDRYDSSPDEETIVMDAHLVGLVIGRQGENLRRIEGETGCRVQFLTGPDNNGPNRSCRISGSPRGRVDAKREINRIIDENGGNPIRDTRGTIFTEGMRPMKSHDGSTGNANSGEQNHQIMIPDRTVGLIIGRGGETIRDLQERSGCHVNIVGESKSMNGLRPVNLIGTDAAVEVAKSMIMEIVESDNKASAQGGRDQRRPPRDAGFQSDNHSRGGQTSEHINVPSQAVGMIIGKGGDTIRELQSSSGCKINVSQPSGPDIERDIELVGAPDAIEMAKGLIWEKVDAIKDRGPSSRGGRRGGPSRDHGDSYSDRPSHGHDQGHYNQPQQASYPQQQQQPSQVNAAEAGASGDDPYAQYGGYQNYVAMWYAHLAQQAQGQNAAGSGEQPNSSGA